MAHIFENYPGGAPRKVKGRDIYAQINRYSGEKQSSKAQRLGEYFTWRAAWYLATGSVLLENSDQEVDTGMLQYYADQIQEKGANDYARMAYLNMVPTPFPRELNTDGFVAKFGLAIPPYPEDDAAVYERRVNAVRESQGRKRSLT